MLHRLEMQDSWAHIASFLEGVAVQASLAVLPLVGGGDKEAVDRAAVDAIRDAFARSAYTGRVVTCEGEKDEAPRFVPNELLGPGQLASMDLAIDPVDGTSAAAHSRKGALVIIAAAPKGALHALDTTAYCNKLAVGSALSGTVDLGMSPEEIIAVATRVLGRTPLVALLQRPRNLALCRVLEQEECTIQMLRDSDVSATLGTCLETSAVDILMGIGGSPEAVACAVALKCMGGDLQCSPWARNEVEAIALESSRQSQVTLTISDLVRSDCAAVAVAAVTQTLALGPLKNGALPCLVAHTAAQQAAEVRVELYPFQ